MSTHVKEFISFLKKYQVIGLAIAVIIGGKLNMFVGSLVNDLFVPLIFQPILKASRVENISELSFHGVRYGKVIASFVDFLLVAVIVFLFAKFVLKQSEVDKK